VKSGADGIAGHLLQLGGNNGGEQGAVLICSLTLGEITVLPRACSSPKAKYHSPACNR
jgi:hypothetical protein